MSDNEAFERPVRDCKSTERDGMMAGEARKPVRVYVDGCFDMVHFGHANAIRQAKQLGDYLIVGVHSDAEITKHKGPSVYPEEERYELIRAIKWVDEVLVNAPYICTVELLDELKCDFVAHGDDTTISAETGEDVYKTIKESGRYREFRRTGGVSTTDLVGRMLLITKEHHRRDSVDAPDRSATSEIGLDHSTKSPYTGTAQFLSTSQKIVQFSSGKDPNPGDRIVYVSGAFDMLHVGHIQFLKKAAEEGDFLIVGLHTDQVVNKYKGRNYPIMNLQERLLCILSCKYVSEVVIGAPYDVTAQLLDHFKVDVVCHGRTVIQPLPAGDDPFKVPRDRHIFKVIDSGNKVTTNEVVERIITNRLRYELRNKKKEGRELQLIEKLSCKPESYTIDQIHSTSPL